MVNMVRKTVWFAVGVGLILGLAPTAARAAAAAENQAPPVRSEMLVTTDWLARNLDNPDLESRLQPVLLPPEGGTPNLFSQQARADHGPRFSLVLLAGPFYGLVTRAHGRTGEHAGHNHHGRGSNAAARGGGD